MIKLLILAVLLTAFTTLTGMQISIAQFVDHANSTGNTFAAASEFPTGTPTPTPPLTAPLINEIFNAALNPDEWIELFNPSNTAIDISGWKITDNSATDIIPTASIIPAGGYAIIVATPSSVVIPNPAIKITLNSVNIGGGLAQGSDKIILSNTTDTVIDALSWGTNTDVFITPAPTPAAGNSLRRIPNGTDTNTGSDWSNGTSSIGVSN